MFMQLPQWQVAVTFSAPGLSGNRFTTTFSVSQADVDAFLRVLVANGLSFSVRPQDRAESGKP